MKDGTILVLPGWALTGELMQPFTDRLAGHGQLVGSSPAELLARQAGTTTAGDSAAPSPYARALDALVSSCPRPCTVVAWSMAGVIALEALARCATNIDALVAVASTARFCRGPGYPCGVSRRKLNAFRVLLRRAPVSTLRVFFRNTWYPERLSAGGLRDNIRVALGTGQDSLHAGLEYLETTDLRAELAGIRTPTLLVHGTRDRVIDCSAGKFLASRLENAKLCIREGEGHALPLAAPARMAADVTGFMQEKL